MMDRDQLRLEAVRALYAARRARRAALRECDKIAKAIADTLLEQRGNVIPFPKREGRS